MSRLSGFSGTAVGGFEDEDALGRSCLRHFGFG
jgi:hypothetical protein